MTTPTRVYLLRHAETTNPAIFHGAESDVGLSETGRQQAEAIARYFAGRHVEGVVSSAMRRARDTAQPIADACGLPLLVEPALHERRVGVLSGTPTNDPNGVWPETARRWAAGETSYATGGAESFDDIRGRVLPVWERITRTHAGKTMVVVAHGVVCKVLLLSLLPGYTVADWPRLGPIHNVAVTELLETARSWQALTLNQQPAIVRERPSS
jgi:2,3-bisphosphoglycerate-dependent phosphoglycerate mutase